ncbi:MAG: adenylyltransferase/cytidyltransferase family protein [Planctomycetota bacterium]
MLEKNQRQDGGISGDYRRKMVSVDRLTQIVTDLRSNATGSAEGRPTVVLCHGCFDIVHPGHIRYLEFARTQGDLLVVSITGDALISKGDQRPYIPQELRAENLAALELVDFVVVDSNPTACSLIQLIRPDVYVKGQEYATSQDPRFLAERQVVEAGGGRVIFSSGDVVFSSSRLGELISRPDHDSPTLDSLSAVCRRHAIDEPRLTSFLDDMRGKRVLIFGDIFVDRYVLCDATDIASESPMMSLNALDKRDYLGGAAFVAAQVAAMGADPLLVTGLSEDDLSAWAMDALAEAGVEVRASRHRPELAVQTRFLVDDHKLFRVDRTVVRPLDSVGERRASDILVDEAGHADAAIIYDSGYGIITPGVLQQLGTTFRQRLPLLAGGATEPRGNLKVLRDFDLLCSSERKLRVALNDFGSGLSTLAYRVLQKTQAKQMIASLGKRGLVTFDRRSHDRDSANWGDRLCSEHLPSFAARVVDSLGCCESLLAVATLALASGAGLMQAAYLGEAAAAIQIAMPGPAPVRSDDLRRWVIGRPELREPEACDAPAFHSETGSSRNQHAIKVV